MILRYAFRCTALDLRADGVVHFTSRLQQSDCQDNKDIVVKRLEQDFVISRRVPR